MPKKPLGFPQDQEEGVFAPKRNLMKAPMPRIAPVIGTSGTKQTTFPGQSNAAQLGTGAVRRAGLPGVTQVPNAAPAIVPPVSSSVTRPAVKPGFRHFNANEIGMMDPEAWARLQLILGVEPLGG